MTRRTRRIAGLAAVIVVAALAWVWLERDAEERVEENPELRLDD